MRRVFLGTAFAALLAPTAMVPRYNPPGPARPSPTRRKNTGFSGAQLREMRARNGVGRPPKNKPAPYNGTA